MAQDTMEGLFASLVPGDGLLVPVTLQGTKAVLQTVVLRRGGEDSELIYLSQPTEHHWSFRLGKYNPFRWSREKGVLVDRDGDVPRWYTRDIQFERGVGADAAKEYSLVPREEHFKVKIDEAVSEAFPRTPLSRIIAGIVLNGESGPSYKQLSLALDQVGLPHTPEQVYALVNFLELLFRHRMVSSAIYAISASGPDEGGHDEMEA